MFLVLEIEIATPQVSQANNSIYDSSHPRRLTVESIEINFVCQENTGKERSIAQG